MTKQTDPKLAELIAMSEKARREMTVPGNPSEAYFRAKLAEWFRETYTKERA